MFGSTPGRDLAPGKHACVIGAVPTASTVRRTELTPAKRQYFPHPFAQRRQDVIFEPGIPPEPRIVSPARMWQRDDPGKIFLPASDRFGHPSLAFAKVPHLGRSTDQYRQFEIGHRVQNAVSPGSSTHLGRWQVRSGIIVSRKTECHGKDCETASIIEFLHCHSEPCTQPIPGRVREWLSQPVDPGSRCLPGNENRRRGRQPRNRPGTVCGSGPPKFRPANSAGADFLFETVNRMTHIVEYSWIEPLFRRPRCQATRAFPRHVLATVAGRAQAPIRACSNGRAGFPPRTNRRQAHHARHPCP